MQKGLWMIKKVEYNGVNQELANMLKESKLLKDQESNNLNTNLWMLLKKLKKLIFPNQKNKLKILKW